MPSGLARVRGSLTIFKMLATLKFVALALLAVDASALSKPKVRRPLTFSQDGTFQIAIFEDLHYGECKQSHLVA